VAIFSIRLPGSLVRRLDDLSSASGATRSELVREAVDQYCRRARPSRKPDPIDLLDKLVDYEGSGLSDLGSRSEQHLRKLFRERRRRRPR
jgi:metal-responsive CopG/Arc/MetJ family transcriptional regulator